MRMARTLGGIRWACGSRKQGHSFPLRGIAVHACGVRPDALQFVVDGLRKVLVGRRVTLGSGRNRVTFTLSSLDASIGHAAAATGQVDDVSIVAENVVWRSHPIASVSARLHNVHHRLGDRPVLVSAPVDVSLLLTDEVVGAFIARHHPAMTVEISQAGRIHLRHTRRPQWGYVEVRPAIEYGALVVRPTGVGRGVRRWHFGRPIVAMRPKVTLPDGMRLIGVEVHASRCRGPRSRRRVAA